METKKYKSAKEVPASEWPWPNFSPAEFTASDTGEIVVYPDFMDRLQALRTIYGKRMTVTSGTRSDKRNAEIGGVDDSEHEHGSGCDVAAVDSRAKYEILSAAFRAGFRRIGIYKTHLHLGADPARDQDVVWVGK